jgi:hypothetical protein
MAAARDSGMNELFSKVEGPLPAALDSIHDDSRVRAAKEDDAVIPFFLWDARIARLHWGLKNAADLNPGQLAALSTLRAVAHRSCLRLLVAIQEHD